MTTRICVVGSSNIDLIAKVPRLPKLGETLVGHSFHLGYGGKGANQAVMAARLGAEVVMVTKVGRDVFGEGTLENYRQQGIDSAHVLFDDARFSGVAPIFVDDDGRNVIVIVPGANMGLTPDDVRRAQDVIRSAAVLICQLEIPVESTLEALRIGRAAGIRTILNPAPAAVLPDDLLALADYCVPNETEAELLTGLPVVSIDEASTAAAALLDRGSKTVIITLGPRGALVADRGSVSHYPAVEVPAVDSTGAGDAFVGSLAVFLAEGVPLPRSVAQANAVAALSVATIGTQVSFPSRAEADTFLRERGLL
ncbi:MAG TPA: ribokinase [bacterium]|nr:ribokinase [bacterium]